MSESIPPLEGVDGLTGALDALAATPVVKQRLPVVVFEDAADAPRGYAGRYVRGFQERLLTMGKQGIVPHAVVGRKLLRRAAVSEEPDVVLIGDIAGQFDQTMPARTKSRRATGLALPTYWVCRKVLDTDVGVGAPHEQRRYLTEALYAEWQARTPGLPALQRLAQDQTIGQRMGIFASVLIAMPAQWLYVTWLNRTKRLRWFAQQVRQANAPCEDFLSAATHLGRHGSLRDRAALRQSVLLEALAMDLTRASRRGLFNPLRRRRVWPFVALLPGADDPETVTEEPPHVPAERLNALGERLLDALLDLRGWERDTWPRRLRRRGIPLLVLAARSAAPPEDAPDRPEAEDRADTAQRAAAVLQSLLAHKPASSGNGPSGKVRVALGGDTRPSVRDWLERHIAVQPRKVRRPSAYLGWLMALIVLLAGVPAAVVVTKAWPDACDTWSADGARVGIDAASQGSGDHCYFTSATDQQLLRDLQDRIRHQNATAEQQGKFRTVVFLAPLTANPHAGTGQITPAGVLQLRGAARAQARYNEQVRVNPTIPSLRMVVANVGYAYSQSRAVVKRLNAMASKDHSIVAVIGIAQSRQQSVDAINQLHPDLPVIGASVTGDFMTTDTTTYFQTQPTSRDMARIMARRAARLKRTKALIVYDDRDRYSTNLRADLKDELRRRGIGVVPAAIVRDSPTQQLTVHDRLEETAARICAHGRTDTITLYAARGNGLPRVLNAVQAKCGADGRTAADPVPILACDVNTLIEYPELPEFAHLERYTAVDLAYVAFSRNRHSDTDTGSDAFRAAAAAIDRVWNANNPPRATNVLQQLVSGIRVADNVDPSRRFTIPPDNKPPTGRPLYLCAVPHTLGGVPSCEPDGEEP